MSKSRLIISHLTTIEGIDKIFSPALQNIIVELAKVVEEAIMDLKFVITANIYARKEVHFEYSTQK